MKNRIINNDGLYIIKQIKDENTSVQELIISKEEFIEMYYRWIKANNSN